jgi:type IV fimbrial biogenesis protein FimT
MTNPLISIIIRTKPEGQARGFSLSELLATLAIASILLAVGLPPLVDFVKSQSVKSASFDITSMLIFARSEAIKRNTNVEVTPTSGSWENGWSITATIGGTATTLGKQAAFSGLTITTSATSITYGTNGRIQGTTPPSFQVSGSSGTRCVSVSLSGLPNSKIGNC